MRLTKQMQLYANVTFEFGAAAINPFNRHTRGLVTTGVTSADFGKIWINGSGQRALQLEARLAR